MSSFCVNNEKILYTCGILENLHREKRPDIEKKYMTDTILHMTAKLFREKRHDANRENVTNFC